MTHSSLFSRFTTLLEKAPDSLERDQVLDLLQRAARVYIASSLIPRLRTLVHTHPEQISDRVAQVAFPANAIWFEYPTAGRVPDGITASVDSQSGALPSSVGYLVFEHPASTSAWGLLPVWEIGEEIAHGLVISIFDPQKLSAIEREDDDPAGVIRALVNASATFSPEPFLNQMAAASLSGGPEATITRLEQGAQRDVSAELPYLLGIALLLRSNAALAVEGEDGWLHVEATRRKPGIYLSAKRRLGLSGPQGFHPGLSSLVWDD